MTNRDILVSERHGAELYVYGRRNGDAAAAALQAGASPSFASLGAQVLFAMLSDVDSEAVAAAVAAATRAAAEAEAARQEAARLRTQLEAATRAAAGSEASQQEAARLRTQLEAATRGAAEAEAARQEAARLRTQLEAATRGAAGSEASQQEAARLRTQLEAATRAAAGYEASQQEAARLRTQLEAATRGAVKAEAARQEAARLRAQLEAAASSNGAPPTDEEMERAVLVVLQGSSAPATSGAGRGPTQRLTVLDIRAKLPLAGDPGRLPETQQLNRVLHSMAHRKLIEKGDPVPGRSSKKPVWSLQLQCLM
jgi:hypothetical protein